MNHNVTRKSEPARSVKHALLLATLLTLPMTLAAQDVPPVSPNPAPAPAGKPANTTTATGTPDKSDDDVVKLDAFQVSATAQTGYIASESMTGSRLPTKVIDLPFTIEFVTSEFMDDFAVIDESTIVEGGVITGDQDSGGGKTIRGISSNGQLVNGFWQPAGTPIPTALKDRIEILKGPSAGTYGQTSPGGMTNIVTKRAKFNLNSTKIRLLYGSYKQMLGALEQNLALTRDTALLVMLTGNDREFTQKWRENSTYTGALNLRHKLSDTAQLSIDFQYTRQRNKAPANRIPYYYDSTYVNNTLYTPPGTNPATGQPWPTQTFTSSGKYYDYAKELEDTTGTGPKSWSNTDAFSIFATYEKRINSVFSFRIGADYFTNHLESYNTTALTVYDPVASHAVATDPYSSAGFGGLNRFFSASSSYSAPGYQKNNQDCGGIQGDLLAHYKMLNNKVECRTLFTFDFSSRYQYIEKWSMPQRIDKANSDGSPSTKNAVDPSVFPWDPKTIGSTPTLTSDYFWQNYWLPVVDPLSGTSPYVDLAANPQYDIYHVPDFDKTKFLLRSSQTSRRDVMGLMARQQMTLFTKLILYGAIRFDNVTYDYATTPYPSWSLKSYPQYAAYWNATTSVAKWHSANWTPSAGVNYRARRWLALYGNYSTSFNPSGQPVSGATTASVILPNERAWGYDYGVKISALKDKLTATLGGFYINQYNISVTAEDPTSALSVKQAVGNVLSRGMEASANYFITKAWSVKAGYYHTNAKWIYAGSDKDLNGRSRAGVPPDIITIATKYGFQNGFLKGLSAYGMFQYMAPSPSDEGGGKSITPKDPVTGKNLPSITPVGSNNGLRDLVIPSVYTIDLGLSYTFKTPVFGLKTRNTVQLNVKNVLNHEYITISRGVADTRNIMLSYTLSF